LPTVVITGAFSYSGSYIEEAFLEDGWTVRTLTRNPERAHRLQGKIDANPLDFEKIEDIEKDLRGASVLVNSYWVRFDHGDSSFAQAIQNSERLFQAAQRAGVKRIIHLSVSNADLDSELPYYSGKAKVENALMKLGPGISILRPTLIFGDEELLLNNIAWLLRKLPIFVIPVNGEYRLQPIYIKDLANLALRESKERGNRIIDAAGPEVLSFSDLIQKLIELTKSRTLRLHLPPRIAILLAKLLSVFLKDVLLTMDELQGLMQEKLYVGDDRIDGLKFSEWARQHAHKLGLSYTNELNRHHQKLSK
jgi:uncharacterized protein YbjT (DUF2867 family)